MQNKIINTAPSFARIDVFKSITNSFKIISGIEIKIKFIVNWSMSLMSGEYLHIKIKLYSVDRCRFVGTNVLLNPSLELLIVFLLIVNHSQKWLRGYDKQLV